MDQNTMATKKTFYYIRSNLSESKLARPITQLPFNAFLIYKGRLISPQTNPVNIKLKSGYGAIELDCNRYK